MIKLEGATVLAETIARIIGVASYDMILHEWQHKHLRDGLSRGQLLSKLKVVELLYNYRFNKAGFIGHWHGGLPYLLKRWSIIKCGVGLELDPFWSHFSSKVNWDWDFTSLTGDACNYDGEGLIGCDVVINTSCEHMNWDWLQKVPNNSHLLIQATDMEAPDHINKIDSISKLQDIISGFNREILKTDVLELHNGYSRWSVLAR